MGRPALEVADIFRAHGPAWRQAQRAHLSLGQLKVMSAIEQCRSAALGGHVLRCNACEPLEIAYNSCRNRHCLLPSGFHRIRHYGLFANAGCKENLARVRELLLPEAPRVDAMLTAAEASGDPVPPSFVCPCCGAAMIIIDTLVRGQPIRAPPQQRAAA